VVRAETTSLIDVLYAAVRPSADIWGQLSGVPHQGRGELCVGQTQQKPTDPPTSNRGRTVEDMATSVRRGSAHSVPELSADLLGPGAPVRCSSELTKDTPDNLNACWSPASSTSVRSRSSNISATPDDLAAAA